MSISGEQRAKQKAHDILLAMAGLRQHPDDGQIDMSYLYPCAKHLIPKYPVPKYPAMKESFKALIKDLRRFWK